MDTAIQMTTLPQDFDFSPFEYIPQNATASAFTGFEQAGVLVGCAFLRDVVEREKDGQTVRTLEVERIEVLEKGQGHGRAIIAHLFEALQLDEMIGNVQRVFEDSDDVFARSYAFWNHLGASFIGEREDTFEAFSHGELVQFTLTKKTLVKDSSVSVYERHSVESFNERYETQIQKGMDLSEMTAHLEELDYGIFGASYRPEDLIEEEEQERQSNDEEVLPLRIVQIDDAFIAFLQGI